MKRKILISCALLIFSFGVANAQRTCGTMSHMAMQQAADPVGFAKRMQLIEQQVQQWKQKNANSKTSKVIITIPTVVHVVWNTSSQNISDAQVISQIAVLNEDFRRLNADAANTPSWFLGVAADTEIEFCLAQRDPSGVPTNGITRTQTSVTSFTGNAVKSTSSGGKDPWPRDDYLNFWVCNLGGGLLGFAEFPGGPASTDGVVCTYTSIGRPPDNPFSSPFNLGRTATHEIGHWLALYHTFQNGCAGTSSGTCGTAGDRVCDTPPTSSSNNGCPSINQNTCTETPVDENDQHMNFMDYTNDACMNLFTQGQKTRMVGVLNGTRLSIQSSLGCIPPNLFNLDAGISAIIAPDGSICNQGTINPVITLKNFGSNTLTSVTINYDIDGGPNNTYSWTGSLSSFATEDVTLPSIAVSAGTHTFNASTSTPNGSADQDNTNDALSSSFNSISSTAPTVISASRCGTGVVTLSASGNNTLNWYDDSLAGNFVNTGTTYTTPSLSTTTYYYVENEIIPPLQYVGPPDNSTGTGGNHTNTAYYLIFDCFSSFTLKSVKVYATGTGFRIIELRNSAGTVLQDTTVNLPNGESRITLNFNITPGTNYQLATGGTFSDMYRNNSGVSFPYTLPGVVSITGNNIPDPNYYYYYYDWEIQELSCKSARIQVTATIYQEPTATITASSNTICGVCSGDATVSGSGGAAPYTYLWSDGQSTATATGFCTGSYCVTVTDANGCSDTACVTISGPPAITITLSSINATCNMPDGQASVIASNGVAPYTYFWNIIPPQTTATATGLYAGAYTVTITDANGCSVTGIVTVNNIVPTVSVTSSFNVSCNGGSDGEATVAASGGIPPYTYQWNDPDSQATATATGLMAGTYTVGVTDTSGCTSFSIVTINEPDSLLLIMSSVSTSCGNNNGSVSVSVSGGTGPYTYLWNDSLNQTTPTATGLSAGDFTVTITDINNCIVNATISVDEAGAPILNLTSTEVSCNGGSDGTATVTATSGTAPYTYLWNLPDSVQTTPTATGLSAGTYIITVTDANNCQISTSEIISEPDALIIITFSNDATPDTCDGEAIVSVNGGTPPYTYQWDTAAGNQTTVTATGLCPGPYSVIVTDTSGCVNSANVIVGETTGIFEVNSNLIFNIYPNPASGTVNIEFTLDKPKDINITVTNVIGEIVSITELSARGGSEIYTIDVSKKANGIYFIHIVTDNEVVVQKVSVIK